MRILSIDCESNGLHGTIFAVGAVIIDTEDPDRLYNPIAQFTGYVDIRLDEDIDPWVEQNVIPFIDDLDRFDDTGEMRREFWVWYIKNQFPLSDPGIVLADFAYPVEARFFSTLTYDDLEGRMWKGPYPLHELGTLLLAVGADPDKTNRRTWWHDLYTDIQVIAPLRQHNPLDDALAAARCAVKALVYLNLV